MTRSRTPVAAFLAAAALLFAGCSADPAPPSGPAAPPAAAPDSPAAAPAARAAPARAVQESSGVEAAPAEGTAADASLERLTHLAAQDQLPTGRWQAGRHYKPLVPAQPTNVAGGKVEVLEVFWYGCGHCAALDPFLENWKKKTKPANVEFVRVPVTWSPGHIMHGRLFYTLEALGREDLHPKVFDTIHRGGNGLLGNDEASTLEAQRNWARANGIDPKAFTDAWNSMGVAMKLRQADDLLKRYKPGGTPFMVINGRYTTDVGSAGGIPQMLSLIDDLVAAERGAGR